MYLLVSTSKISIAKISRAVGPQEVLCKLAYKTVIHGHLFRHYKHDVKMIGKLDYNKMITQL